MKLKTPISSVTRGAERAQPESPPAAQSDFPIVGIGGSAGALEAFTQLLEHVPASTGMAFVIVQHLDPGHESALPHILGRATSMPVREAAQGMAIQPNEVYVIPPNATMSLSRGRLEIAPREKSRMPHLSIDIFFQSLAREQHERAIGVVFSGSASDGTNGLEAIKASGGLTFAQDKSARYDSMPRSAVASGCVDYVLSPHAIALELARIATHPYLRGVLPPLPKDLMGDNAQSSAAPGEPTGARPRRAAQGFARIMELTQAHFGVDFTLYKTNTIHRRITRRMLLSRKNTLDEYAQFVSGDLGEHKLLFEDLLISVTSFFRDEAAFDLLRKVVIPKLLAKPPGSALRLWVIGCSGGHEAYSLAMTFMEAAEGQTRRLPKVQIFGTDLNERLLNHARHGLYPSSLAHELSPERLRKFFVEEDGGYRVIKSLREMCVFGRQDLLADPPFSRMDLVSCRNVMIYIEASAQKRVLPMLHYALKPGGYLFLGSSETTGAHADLFEPVDRKQKIFLRNAIPTPLFSLPVRDRRSPEPVGRRHRDRPLETGQSELHAPQEADRVLANLFSPPAVLIDASLNVLQFRGATEAFLTPASGKASFQLLKLARDWLVLPLRAAINRAGKLNEVVRRENVRAGDDRASTITLQVIPLKNLRERCFLVVFETPGRGEAGAGTDGLAAAPAVPGPKDDRALKRRNVELERELRETRDYLHSLQQQHDTAHDDLQSMNEEVQSANEELQSMNEELETSKEELESGNEELITVNEEMAYRNGELSRLNSDLNNFHVSLNTPIVVLGRDLTVRRFTPMAEKIFNLLRTDIGRPLSGIKHNLLFDDLESFVGKVIQLLAVRESEVRDKEGHWYLLRARPYLTVDNMIDGAVLVLLDIDTLKRTQRAAAEERTYAEAALRTSRDSLLILRPDLTVITANEAFYRDFVLTPGETENRLLFDLAEGAWNIPALHELLAEILPHNHVFNDLEMTHRFGHRGERTLLLNGRRLDSVEGTPLRILLSIEDITDRLHSRAVLRASEIRYRRLFEAAKDGVLIIDPGTRRITDANPFLTQLLGFRRDELIGKELYEIGVFSDEQSAQAAFLQLRAKKEIRYDFLPLRGKDGAAHEVEVVANLYEEDGREVIQCNVRDIAERRRMEKALVRSNARFEAIVEQATAGIAELDLAGRFTLVNERFCNLVGRTPAELIGTLARDITHPEDWTDSPVHFTGLAKGRADFSVEKRYLRPDGTVVSMSNSVAWITDRDGIPHGLVEIAQDISERKRLEAVVRTSESYFRELTQNLPIGVWTSLPDGSVDFINSHWLEYTGQTTSPDTNHPFRPTAQQPEVWVNTLHPDDRARVAHMTATSRAAGESYSFEARFRRAQDGEYRWFLTRSVPVFDSAGQLQKRIGICFDIEELKRAQGVLAHHADELELQVLDRTAELRETIGELEAFSYSVSHDMRAPLRAMQGFSQMVLRDNEHSLDARSVDHLRRINASAARLDALISDVLTYSSLLRSEIVLQPVNLDDAVRQVVTAYPQLQANGAEIVFAGSLPTVLANEASLTQVISNLLSNAVKFVPRGTKPHIRIHGDEIDGDGRFWIEDNGIGIDAVNHQRIWNLFTRIERAKDYDGTGIGLAIVRKAVERMNGTIGLESAPGEGCRFWVRLPKA